MIKTRLITNLTFVLFTFLLTAPVFAVDPNESAEQEAEMLAILRSGAPVAEKAIACKKLAIYGSDAAVPELGKLLPNPQLSSWARIALEAIPGEAPDEALRVACQSLDGRLLVGVINSIGIRRDANAAASLAEYLDGNDADVASAAAVALGRIGNEDATQSLQKALATSQPDVRNAIAEGYVLCAERRLASGQSDAAIKIYDEIRNTKVPTQRVIEATRGAILARGKDGIPLLKETLQSSDKKFFQLALGVAREFPGGDVDTTLASELDRATPSRAALIILAMADRPDTVVLAAILQAAE